MSNLAKLTSCTIFNKAVGAGFTNSLKTLKSNLGKPAPTNLLMRMVQKMNFNTLFLTKNFSADALL
jgi:hypothetical protein